MLADATELFERAWDMSGLAGVVLVAVALGLWRVCKFLSPLISDYFEELKLASKSNRECLAGLKSAIEVNHVRNEADQRTISEKIGAVHSDVVLVKRGVHRLLGEKGEVLDE